MIVPGQMVKLFASDNSIETEPLYVVTVGIRTVTYLFSPVSGFRSLSSSTSDYTFSR